MSRTGNDFDLRAQFASGPEVLQIEELTSFEARSGSRTAASGVKRLTVVLLFLTTQHLGCKPVPYAICGAFTVTNALPEVHLPG